MIAPWTVEIVPYNPAWPTHFKELRAVLGAALGGVALRIEHVGSTSVPALAAKPILDVDVVVASPEHLTEVISILAGLGYQHRGDLGVAGREAFWREGEDVPRVGTGRSWPAHHLYVCPRDSPELARHLQLRNILRNNSQACSQYAALKQELALCFREDREAYTEGKTAFIESLLRAALQ